ncbi:MAG TPA: hypothetical protein VFV80_01015 [Geminicoccaceae bacterium]|nr:hypothetical protein [Geminicoccaceae bacterium]
MKDLPLLDSCELEDDRPLAERRAAFGIEDKPIDTALRRLHSWALVAIGGSVNVVRVDGVTYIWEAQPRALKNGALQGRVYAQAAGESPRDVGGFKIDAGGRVLQIPAPLAGVLPGAEHATEELP